MVSIAIGLLVVAGLATMYSSISRTNAELAKVNGVIDSGRFAVDVLAEDISHAGFWGGFVPQFDELVTTTAPADVPTASPDPCLAFASWNADYRNAILGIPIQVYGDVPGTCGGILTNRVANTDIVVVRHAGHCAAGMAPPTGGASCPDPASVVYMQRSFCATQITSGSPTFVIDNQTATFTLSQRDCATPAERRQYQSHIYYIRDHAVTPGDGIPTLVRSHFDVVAGTPAHVAPIPLVEGIQALHVELGFDAQSRCNTPANFASAPVRVDPTTCTVNAVNPEFNTAPNNRGDGVPEPPFVHCTGAAGCTAAQLMNAVVAKVYVLARSTQPTAGHVDAKTYTLGSATFGPFNDAFQRHAFQMTVRLNNVSSRRETP